MATAAEVPIFVESSEDGQGVRVVSPSGTPRLNKWGVEIANIGRRAGDKEFNFAQPVEIVGIDQFGRFQIKIGGHTTMYVDPVKDDYFLIGT